MNTPTSTNRAFARFVGRTYGSLYNERSLPMSVRPHATLYESQIQFLAVSLKSPLQNQLRNFVQVFCTKVGGFPFRSSVRIEIVRAP